MEERRVVAALFRELLKQPQTCFPGSRQRLDATRGRGVYVIRDPLQRVVHVGRTPRAKGGIYQRLNDHLAGRSSFVYYHLKGAPSRLRNGYTFQYLVVEDARKRALLEALASAYLCPEHLGLADAAESECSG